MKHTITFPPTMFDPDSELRRAAIERCRELDKSWPSAFPAKSIDPDRAGFRLTVRRESQCRRCGWKIVSDFPHESHLWTYHPDPDNPVAGGWECCFCRPHGGMWKKPFRALAIWLRFGIGRITKGQ